jgi:hypothetical protein
MFDCALAGHEDDPAREQAALEAALDDYHRRGLLVDGDRLRLRALLGPADPAEGPDEPPPQHEPGTPPSPAAAPEEPAKPDSSRVPASPEAISVTLALLARTRRDPTLDRDSRARALDTLAEELERLLGGLAATPPEEEVVRAAARLGIATIADPPPTPPPERPVAVAPPLAGPARSARREERPSAADLGDPSLTGRMWPGFAGPVGAGSGAVPGGGPVPELGAQPHPTGSSVDSEWAEELARAIASNAVPDVGDPPPIRAGEAGSEAPPTASARSRVHRDVRPAAGAAGRRARPVVLRAQLPRPTPPPPPPFFEAALTALLEEVGVNWLLFSGVVLVLGAGILLAIKHWSSMQPWLQYALILGSTLGFFGLAVGTRMTLGLRRTPLALFAIVLLFTPLNIVAVDVLDLFSRSGPAAPLGQAAACAGMAALLAMGILGSRWILDVDPWLFAPGLFASSLCYLVAAELGAGMDSVWARLALVVATVLVARTQLSTSVVLLHERGLLPVVLCALSIATLSTGIRLGRDLVSVGLAIVATAHLWVEAGITLETSARGPLQSEPGPAARALTTIGEQGALAGSCLMLIPRPDRSPAGLLALAYASRVLYTSFLVFRSSFAFLLFLLTPAVLLMLLPHADPRLVDLWLRPLLEKGRDIPEAVFCSYLVPMALVGPFYSFLACRLTRRDLTGPCSLLHIGGAAVAVITLVATFIFEWAGLAAAALTVMSWGLLAMTTGHAYMNGVPLLGIGALVVHAIRILDQPYWVWLLALVVLAHGLLILTMMGMTRADPGKSVIRSLVDFLFPASFTAAGIAVVAYLNALLTGQIAPGGSWVYDLILLLLVAYFVESLYVEYSRVTAVGPVLLVILEGWVVLCRLFPMESLPWGFILIGSAVFSVACGAALTSRAGVRIVVASGPAGLRDPGSRAGLQVVCYRLAQALTTLSFFCPPFFSWAGCAKYLVLAGIHGFVSSILPDSVPVAGLCLAIALHAPFSVDLRDPGSCLGLQVVDLALGVGALALLARPGTRAARSGMLLTTGQTLAGFSSLFLVLGGLLRQTPPALLQSLTAGLLQAGLGLTCIVIAIRVQRESCVYIGEAALALAYARLWMDGLLPRTLVVGIVAVAASFVLLLAHGQFLAQRPWTIYRGPAVNTALALPLFALLRALQHGGANGAGLVLAIGFFYHLASVRIAGPQCLYFGLLLYNVASEMLSGGPAFLSGLRSLGPGLTLLAYSHTPGAGSSRDQVLACRAAGLFLMFVGPAARALLGTHDDVAFLLLIGFSLLIGAVGLALRVRLYVGASSATMVLTVVVFVSQQVFRSTHVGLLLMMILGILLILAAAVFEQARARLRKVVATLAQRFQGWE